MNFNLADYEPVEERLSRFYKEHKDGRILTDMVSYTDDRVVFKANLFRNFDADKVWATGYAEETRGKGGPVNTTSHVENCETSAIGRALANAGYAPKGKRPSREEMAKVQRITSEVVKPAVELRTQPSAESPNCPKCGAPMRMSQTGKLYCSALCWKKEEYADQ
jgi:hypothetical protein